MQIKRIVAGIVLGTFLVVGLQGAEAKNDQEKYVYFAVRDSRKRIIQVGSKGNDGFVERLLEDGSPDKLFLQCGSSMNLIGEKGKVRLENVLLARDKFFTIGVEGSSSLLIGLLKLAERTDLPVDGKYEFNYRGQLLNEMDVEIQRISGAFLNRDDSIIISYDTSHTTEHVHLMFQEDGDQAQ